MDRSGCSSDGAAAACHVDDLDAVAVLEVGGQELPQELLGLRRAAVGGEAVRHHQRHQVGDDVARHAAVDLDRLERLPVTAPVDLGLAGLVCDRVRPSSSPERWIAFRPIQARAMWARASVDGHPRPDRSLASRLDRTVGRLAEQGQVADEQVGSEIEQLGRARCGPTPPPRGRRRRR